MKKSLVLMLALIAAGSASAHTGHGTHSLMEGLSHPLGWDHLLAMVAVGAWSVAALPHGQRWAAPATFVGSMTLAAALGAMGMSLPLGEHAIALSVALLGAMLLVGQRIGTRTGLALIALAAMFHGLAHGAELPAGGLFAAYALGFVVSTLALHISGVGLGLVLRRAGQWAWRIAGAVLAAAGLALVAQL